MGPWGRTIRLLALVGFGCSLALGGVGCLLDQEYEPPIVADFSNEQAVGSTCSKNEECAGVCAFGRCRGWCTTMAPGNCQRGGQSSTTCLNGACRLSDENHCGESDPCPGGLVCAIDHSCRLPCSADNPCKNPGDECIGGSCVNAGEPGINLKWFECTDAGSRSCDSNIMVSCHTDGLGISEDAICQTPAACQTALASNGLCPAN